MNPQIGALFVQVAYIAASAAFILGLRGLTKPDTARRGMQLAAAGMLLAIIGMAVATYLCRAGGYALFRALRPPRYVEVVLQHLPGPIFMAYAMPALAAHGWKGWVAAVAVVAVQYFSRSLAAAILVGVGAMAGLGAFEAWYLAR